MQPRGICSRCWSRGWGRIRNFTVARGCALAYPPGAIDTRVSERWMSLSRRTRPLSKTGLSVRDYKDLSMRFLKIFIIKFPYNARSDWLKQRTLSENKELVNDIKLAFKFLLRNFDKFDPN